ncbi:phage minor capsid protein [Alteribacillus sp. JSM 102045]|uniref:phage minor capsid protein n=1 Tax=Alteribacillus sp. JSM 102045 TaxID=1562101 RepID=UPI0035C04528
MINKERLEELSQPVIEIYNGMQAEMLERIARRLAGEIGDSSDIKDWEVRKIEQLGLLTEDNIKVIEERSGKTREEVRKALETAGFEGIEENESMLENALERGADLNNPGTPESSERLFDILGAYQAQAEDIFNKTNATLIDQSEEVYRRILDRTVAGVTAGIKTPQQALRDSVRSWAHNGVPALIDSAGREWGAEGYVRTVIRSTTNNVTNEMQDHRFDQWGQDLIQTSSHMGARPKCAPYQGKVYSRSGDSKQFPALSSTSIGEPDGLRGINCHHVFYPYFPGLSRKRYQPKNKKENDAAYKRSQRQRKMERDIRNAKTEKRMMEALGDEEGVKLANQRIFDRQAKMRKFIKDTGRTRRRNREQVY